VLPAGAYEAIKKSSFTCPPSKYEVLKAAEESERDIIARLVGKIATRKRPR